MRWKQVYRRGSAVGLLVALALLALLPALGGAPNVARAGQFARAIRNIHSALLHLSELPPPSPTARDYPYDLHRTFSHFDAAMCDKGQYCCEPPRQFAHLGWKQGVSQSISNASYSFVLCAFRFNTASNAHRAFVAFTKPTRNAIRHGAGATSVAVPPVGQERFGYEGRGITYEQIIFRQVNAVVQLGSFESYKDFNNHLIPMLIKVSRHLK